jgi:hypothetical protein
LSLIDITSSTNTRTVFTAVVPAMPHGHSAPVLKCSRQPDLSGIMNSLVFDWTTRLRLSGVHVVWAILEELPLPPEALPAAVVGVLGRLANLGPALSIASIAGTRRGAQPTIGTSMPAERLRLRAMADAVVARVYGLGEDDLRRILADCDASSASIAARSSGRGLDPKGFWRIDKDLEPELRCTVLALVAFRDLEENISICRGDRDAGIEAFLSRNDGEGWMLPETLRLADYGLDHDDRARQQQPVASRLGPRFYDWQLAQSAEESWRECHLHARNLLGAQGYQELLEGTPVRGSRDAVVVDRGDGTQAPPSQGILWEQDRHVMR